MAISIVGASASPASGANPTVTVPVGVIQGDLLIIITMGTATPTTPAGWTSGGAQGASQFITIFYKYADATNASVALTVAGATTRAVMLAYRGASALSGFATSTATAATSIASAAFTTLYDNQYVVNVYASNNVAGTWTLPALTTGRSIATPTATIGGLAIADELQTTAGATASRTATITAAHNLSSAKFTIIPSGRYWVGGTGTWSTSTTNWSFTSGGASGAPAPTLADPVAFDQAGSYTVTMTGALSCYGMDVSAGSPTFTSTGTLNNSGSMSLVAGTVWSATGAILFNSTTSGRTVTTNGTTINANITFSGVGGTWSLGSALTTGATSITNLINGTLNLNGFDLTTGVFSSSIATTRSIVFGTNNIVLVTTTAAQLVLSFAIATGFTFTGTGGFVSDASVTRTYTFGTTGGTATNAPNLSLTGSGTAVQTLTTGSWFNNLDFGTTAFNPGTTALNIDGNLILSSGGTYNALTPTMVGTGAIISNGKTLAGLIINSVSGTTTFGDAPTLVTNSTVTLTSGTLDLNSFSLTTGIFSSSVATTRSIIFGTSSIILNHTTAAQTVLNMATATGFTFTGTGGFRSDAAVTRTYTFGTTGGTAAIAPNLTLTGSGTAVQTLTTASWFRNLDFGTTAFTIPATSLNITVGLTLSATGTYTGLGVAMIGTDSRTVSPNGKTIAAFSVNIGAGTLTLAGALGVTTYTQTSGTVDFAGFNLTGSGAAAYTAGTLNNIGTITCTTWTVTGAFSLTQGTLTPSTSFVLTSGSFTYGPGGTLSAVPTFTHTAGTVTLNQAYALTATGTYTLTAGTLTLGGDLTTGIFSSAVAGVRVINFSTFNIILAHTTAAQTVLNMAVATSFSYTGTGGFVSTSSNITRTFVFGTTGGTSVNAPNLSLTGSGTGIATITTGSWFGVLDFGSTAFTIPATAINVDSISLSSSGTYTSLGVTMRDTGTFTPNGKTIAAFAVNHAGTTTLAGALGATTYTQTAGTIDFATNDLTCSGAVTYTAGTLSNIGTISCTTFTINGPTFNFTSGTINPSVSFVLTTGSFTLGAGANLGSVPTFTHTAGTVTLEKNYSLTSTGTYTLVAGTLTITDKNLTTSAFITTGTATRAINFGTSGYGEITLTGNAKTIWNGGGAGITYTGNLRIVANYTGSVGTRTVFLGLGWTEATAFDVGVHGDSYPNIYGFQIISTGGNPTDIVAISEVVRDFNLNNFSFTVTPGAMTVYGDFTIPAAVSGGTISASASVITFASTNAGARTISIDRTIDFPLTFNGVGGSWNLSNNLTTGATRTVTLTAGTLNLNGNDISTGLFSSTGTGVRSIAFGTNSITVTGTGTVWDTGTVTNLTITGTPVVNVTNATATSTTVNSGALPESTAISFNFTAGTYALTFLGTAGHTAKDVNFTGFSGTLGTTNTCTIYGNYTISSGMTVTASANILTFGATDGTKTIISNGKTTMPGLNINGLGGTFELGDSYTAGSGGLRSITITAGIFITNSFAITFSTFTSTGSNLRAIILGSSTITLNGSISLGSTNLTFNAGTSSITNNNTSAIIVADGHDFYDVSFPLSTSGPGITANSFRNLSLTGPGNILSINYITWGQNTTISGTLTATSANAKQRKIFRGIGVKTITATNVVLSDIGFKSIDAQGNIPWTGTRLSDLGNNSNITFDPPKSVYLSTTVNSASGLSWGDNIWATSPGGTPNANNFPLAQDIAIITNSGWNSSASANTLDFADAPYIGNMDFSPRTLAMQVAAGTVTISGNVTYGSGVTNLGSSTETIIFDANLIGNSQSINFAGKSIPQNLTINVGEGTLKLTNSITQQTGTFLTHTSGTLDLNGFDIITPSYRSNSPNIRQVIFGVNNISMGPIFGTTGSFSVSDATNWSSTGTGGFVSTHIGTTGLAITFGPTGASASNAPNFSISPANAGITAPHNFTTGSWFNNLSFSTNYIGTPVVSTINVAGDLVLTGGTLTGLTVNMQDTGTITSNTKTLAAVSVLGGTTTLSGTLTSTGVFTVNNGTFTHPAGAVLNAATVTLTNSGTINLNGGTLPTTSAFNHTLGTVNITSSISLTATGTYTFTAGTLTLSDGANLTTGIFSSTNTNTRSIAFGDTTVGNINLAHTTAAQTVLGMAIATGFTKSGPGGFVSVMGVTRTFVFGTTGGTASNAPNLSLSGASIPTLTTGSWFNILDFTGSTGNLLVTTVNIANTINLAVGGTYSNVTSNMVDTASIIGNSKTLDAITVLSGTTTISGTVTATPTTVNGGTFTHATGATLNATIFTLTSGTVNLDGGTLPITTTFTHTLGTVNITVSTSLAATATYTLTAGTLTLADGVTLSTGIFSSTNTNTRSIAFGDTTAGNISLTHTTAATTRLNMATATGFTWTGVGGFVTVMGVTATFNFGGTGGGSTSNAVNLSLTGGASIPTFTTNSSFNLLDFTGSTSIPAATVLNLNALTLASGGTYTALGAIMRSTGTITPNGKTIAAFTVNNFPGTTTLAGALGVTTYTQTEGTIDFAGFNLTGSGAAQYTSGTLNNIGTITCTTWTIIGAFTFDQGTITPSTSFILTAGSFTYNVGATLSAVPTFTHTAGTVTLNQSYALTATGTYTFTAGTLTLGGNLTTGIFSSLITNTRAIAFDSNYIYLAHTTAAQTVLNIENANMSWTGTGGFSSAMTVTRTFKAGGTPNTLSAGVNLFITSGAAAITITAGDWYTILDFTGSTSTATVTASSVNVTSLVLGGGTYGFNVTTYNSGTLNANGKTIGTLVIGNNAYTLAPTVTTLLGAASCSTCAIATVGSPTFDFSSYNLTCSSTFSYPAGTLSNIGTITCTTFTINGPTLNLTSGTINPSTSFVLTAGSFTLGSGANLGSVPTFTHTSGTVSLEKNYSLTATGTYTFTTGTLTLGGDLTTGTFSSTTAAYRVISFGANNIILSHTTAAQTVLNMANQANFTYTGTGGFTSPMSVTRTFTSGNTAPINGSALFSNANYLQLPTNSVNQFGTNNFTIECWVYLNSAVTAANRLIWYNYTPTFTTNSIFFGGHASYGGRITFWAYNANTAAPLLQDPTVLTSGVWTHLAVVRDGSNFTLYRDGVSVSTTTSTASIVDNSYTFGGYIGTSGTTSINGYLSNFRIVKGVAVYTGNFTPPTSPLTATQSAGTNISAITGTQTTLLLNTPNNGFFIADSSVNNLTLTNTGTVTANALTPMTVLPAAGQPVNLALTSGASVPTLTTGSNYKILDFTGSSTTPPATLLNILSGLRLSDGGTYTGLNINLTGETSITGNNKTIASMNLVNGTSNTTIDTTGLAVANSVNMPQGALVLSGNLSSNIFATAGSSRTITGSNTTYTIANTWTYSPTGSAVFNGTTQYLTVPNNAALQLATATPFTIEAWVYVTNLSATDHGIIGKRAAGNEWQLNIHPSFGYLNFWNGTTTYQSNITLVVNTWYHVAVTWDATRLRFFVNGVMGSTYTGFTVNSSTNQVVIGAVAAALGLFTGNVSNLRIVKGVAVYTGNFTVPTGPLDATQTANPYGGSNTSAITGVETSLLLNTRNYYDYTTDSSTNNFIATNNGGVTYSASSPAFTTGTPGFTGTGFTIKMAGTGAKTFAGGGGTYPTLDSYGGSLSITGTNTFDDITNSLGGGNVTFSSGTTQTFNNFNLSGLNAGSASFNGTNQYLSLQDPIFTGPVQTAFGFGTGNFTVEAWIYLTTTPADKAPIVSAWYQPDPQAYQFAVNSNNRLEWQLYTQNSPNVADLDISLNTWTHIAFVRTGTVMTTYINGVLKNTTTGVTNSSNGTWSQNLALAPCELGIGHQTALGSIQWFGGRITNLRAVKGVAVYTGNFNPRSQLAATQGASANIAAITGTQTSLLLSTPNDANFIKDFSTNDFTVTNYNSVVPGSPYTFLTYITASTPGSAATLYKSSGTVSVNYLSIQDSTATGGASWYAGDFSVNVSNNSGWIFSGIPSSVSYSNFFAFF